MVEAFGMPRKSVRLSTSSWVSQNRQPWRQRCAMMKSFSAIWRLRGSVFPKALMWALPSAMASAALRIASDYDSAPRILEKTDAAGTIWSGYTFVLGVLVVFRTNQAYARYWEGASLLQQMRGEWFNAVSSLVAFCTSAEERQDEVENFQHLVVRLMSMLFCAALQHVSNIPPEKFEIIDNEGMDEEKLEFLCECENRCAVLLQWTQRLIVEKNHSGLLNIAPPILSRVFQELSRGVVNLNNVRKISEIPWPFPYTQMILAMLILYSLCAPFVASATLSGPIHCAVGTFMVVLVFWAINYVAEEIEQPFGDDDNDLPIPEMLKELNLSLTLLLEPHAQRPPSFKLNEEHFKVSTIGADKRMREPMLVSSFSKGSICSSVSQQNAFKSVRLSRAATSASSAGSRATRRTMLFPVERAPSSLSGDIEESVRQPRSGELDSCHSGSSCFVDETLSATLPRKPHVIEGDGADVTDRGASDTDCSAEKDGLYFVNLLASKDCLNENNAKHMRLIGSEVACAKSSDIVNMRQVSYTPNSREECDTKKVCVSINSATPSHVVLQQGITSPDKPLESTVILGVAHRVSDDRGECHMPSQVHPSKGEIGNHRVRMKEFRRNGASFGLLLENFPLGGIAEKAGVCDAGLQL
eukprot:TRINITY_DN20012_c0_g1_i1.p1 TRINITY_DN20012_c0_g1~~TRINITY_DN20012_c0_g1_i1.p1  ORF type:complete len:641 (-),score=80.26 TRINITY_DN20012_c0_g1_i1:68-1990(-)